MCRRYLSVIASDRVYLAMLAATPILLGLLIRVVPSPQGLTGRDNTDATSLLLVLAVGGCLAGAANAVRELVKERPIYTRERAAGLSAGAYFLSKVLILGVICVVQAVLMLGIGLTGRPLPKQGCVPDSPADAGTAHRAGRADTRVDDGRAAASRPWSTPLTRPCPCWWSW